MSKPGLVTIIGGSGFIGRYVTRRFAKAGWRVRVAVRRPNDALFVKPYGVVGQVEPMQANVRDEASTARAIEGADLVINCAAISFSDPQSRMEEVQVEGAARVARLAKAAGAKHLVHLSAIGANPDGESDYARTKGEGEAAILAEFPTATLIRPSVVFGAEDKFFNRFAGMARFTPFLPVVGPNTRFQPVFVDNVAEAIETTATEHLPGVYELGGPDIATFRELMEAMLTIVRRNRVILTVPFFAARIMGSVLDFGQFVTMGLFQNSMLTRDQVKSLAVDNVVTDGAKGLADLGIEPQAMEGILESYLYSHRPYGQYTALTESADEL